MRTRPTILYFSPDANPVPPLVEQWAQSNAFPLHVFRRPDDVESIVLRGHPSLLFVDGNAGGDSGLALVRRLKGDAFTAIVPVTVWADAHAGERVQQWFAAGADEVLTGLFSPAEQRSRIEATVLRTERDVSVHPSTMASSRSATRTSTTSRNSTIATATTTAIASFTSCREFCTTW